MLYIQPQNMPSMCMTCRKKQANFGFKHPTCCAGCKVDGMQRVRPERKKCEKCRKKQPNFGFVGGKATRCAGCKLEGMQNIHQKRCEVCKKKHVSFGQEGGQATHCSACQLNGMQDVRHRKCEVCKKKNPNFGQEGGRPTHCAECQLDGMQDVKTRKCEVCKTKQASCGIEGAPATRCAGCMSEGMQNLVSRRCLTEGCDVMTKNSQYCANCDTTRKRRTRVREHQLANFLRDNIAILWTAWNKQQPGSRECGGSKRPDFVWLLPYLAIVLECDENQHEGRCLPGERQRMFDIFNIREVECIEL